VAVIAASHYDAVRLGAIRARIVGIDGTVGDERSTDVDLRRGRPVAAIAGSLTAPTELGAILVLDLDMTDDAGVTAASNRYVLARGADLAPLLDLPPATLRVAHGGTPDEWCVCLENIGDVAAIGVDIADDRPIGEPGWAEPDDSSLILLPGEGRTIAIRWTDAAQGGRRCRLEGWNVAPVVVS